MFRFDGKYLAGHPKDKQHLCYKIAKNQLENIPQKHLFNLIL